MRMWKNIQSSSSNLRKAAALIESGKVPHRKDRNNEITRYLRHCTLSKDGLMIAKDENRTQTFMINKKKRIVIPSEFSFNFTTILHKRANHPNETQMLKLFNRSNFMLNAEQIIARVTESCQYPCRALKRIPKETYEYQTEQKQKTPEHTSMLM